MVPSIRCARTLAVVATILSTFGPSMAQGPALATLASAANQDYTPVTVEHDSLGLVTSTLGNGAWPSSLHILQHDPGSRLVEELSKSQSLTDVKRLYLSGGHFGLAGAQALASSPFLHGLESLGLRNQEIGAEGLAIIGSSSGFRELRELSLGDPLDDAALEALARSPLLPRLKALTVHFLKDRSRRGRKALYAASGLALRSLSVRGSLSRIDLNILLGSPLLQTVTELDMGWSSFGDRDAATIAAAASLRNVKTLDLEGASEMCYKKDCTITSKGLASLARSPFLQNLTELNLADNRIGDAGVVALVRGRSLQSLRILNLATNEIGNAGGRALLGWKHLDELQELDLDAHHMSPELRAELYRRLGTRLRMDPDPSKPTDD